MCTACCASDHFLSRSRFSELLFDIPLSMPLILQGVRVHGITDAPVHVSLSRTVVLKFHQIDPFVDSLKRALARRPRYGE